MHERMQHKSFVSLKMQALRMVEEDDDDNSDEDSMEEESDEDSEEEESNDDSNRCLAMINKYHHPNAHLQ